MTPPSTDRFRSALAGCKRLLLATHRHPDPDGLGALLGFQQLLREAFAIETDLVLEGRIRRAENLAMRRLLGIEALPKGAIDPATYDGLALVDTQPGFSHTRPPGSVPLRVVIDHHEPHDAEVEPDADYRWVDPEFGSTSTMVFELMREHGVEPDNRSAVGLFCGIRYDTAHLSRDVTEADLEAYGWLESRIDRKVVAMIDQPELPRTYFREMASALNAASVHGEVLLALLGQVSSPEVVAEVADWFLRLEGQQWSLAGGACDGRYQVSLRTDIPGADAYRHLRAILLECDGSCGGHGRMAGGQIPLTGRTAKEVESQLRERALLVLGGSGTGEPLA